MANPTMTIGDLRKVLAKLPAEHDGKPFAIWLPGSRIDVHGEFIVMGGNALLEGNVREGSALGS